MREIFEKENLVIKVIDEEVTINKVILEMTLNPDRSVKLNSMMNIKYTLSNGQEIEREVYPDCGDNGKGNSIHFQFDYVATIIKSDEVLLRRGVNPK